MDVFRAVWVNCPIYDVGVVSRLGEVVGGLEPPGLAADHPDGAVGLSEFRLLDKVSQLELLTGEAEADEPVEVPDGPGADAKVIGWPVRAVASLGAVLADVMEGCLLLWADLVDAPPDPAPADHPLNP